MLITHTNPSTHATWRPHSQTTQTQDPDRLRRQDDPMRTLNELSNLTREVLGNDYLSIEVTRYTLTEDIAKGEAELVCQMVMVDQDRSRAVEGQGVGLIDALFAGLKDALVTDYPSLGHIHFVDFALSGDFNAAPDNTARTEVPGRVRLTIENTEGRTFDFEATSSSITASSVNAVVRGVEHFVNAERAVLRVLDWIEDARRRSRPDLADTYVRRLSELVQNASYSESIERRKHAVTAG